MTTTSQSPRRRVQRLDIQGLRAVAVLVVVADHVFHVPRGGFVGVDVFFVISGFLITGLLLREVQRTGSISFSKFYERRAKRILPAAAIVIFATVVGAIVLFSRSDAKDVVKDGIFSALFVGNWRFAEQGTDYFQLGTTPSPLQHFWSLGVEEQFYIVWPWALLLIVALAMRVAGWSFARTRTVAVLVIAAITVGSFVWALYETQNNPTYAYFSTFSRAWELGLGALLAFVPSLDLSRTVRRLAAWLGVVGIAVSVVVISGDSVYWPAPLALLPVLSTMLVVLAGSGAANEAHVPFLLRNRVSVYIGDISYSLYLWHFPVAILLLSLLPSGTLIYFGAALVLMFAAASLSFHLVEEPARKADWFRWRGRRVVGLRRVLWRPSVALLLIGAVGLAAFVYVQQVRPSGVSQTEYEVRAVSDLGSPTSEEYCWGAGGIAESDECSGVDLTPLRPSHDLASTDNGIAFRCYMNTDDGFNSCHDGVPPDSDGAYRVAVVGDSHAATMLNSIVPQANELNWSVDSFVGRGCGLSAVGDGDSDCIKPRAEINERLASGDYDLVIATKSINSTLDHDRIDSIMDEIESAGTEIVTVKGVPILDEDAIACATRIGAAESDGCGTAQDEATEGEDEIATVATERGSAVVDMTDFYCANNFCPAISNGTIVYRDAWGHTTATWARTISPYLVERITQAVGR